MAFSFQVVLVSFSKERVNPPHDAGSFFFPRSVFERMVRSEVLCNEGAVFFEHIVPIMLAGAETLDSRVECDHVAGHGLANRVGIKTAVNFKALTDELWDPAWIWLGAGRGHAQAMGMELKTADGIDGGFAQDGSRSAGSRHREVAKVPLGTGRHAAPARA